VYEGFKSRNPKNVKLKPSDENISYTLEEGTDFEEQVIEETTETKVQDSQYDDLDDDDDDEEEDYFDEDDEDYVYKNLQYRNPPEPPKSRRYDLRNSKRNPR